MRQDVELGDSRDFSSMLRSAQRGDKRAIADLYARYAERVTAMVRRRLAPSLRRKYDSLDFTHSVFAEVLRELPGLDDRGEPAFVSLLRIKAENKVWGRYRRHLGRDGRRAEVRLGTNDDVPTRNGSAAGFVETADDEAKLHRLLAESDGTTREILQLRGAGNSFAAIARDLGLPGAEAARKRHVRALARLRLRWHAHGA